MDQNQLITNNKIKCSTKAALNQLNLLDKSYSTTNNLSDLNNNLNNIQNLILTNPLLKHLSSVSSIQSFFEEYGTDYLNSFRNSKPIQRDLLHAAI